jgi:sec-independent protein translocase protein TatA
LWLKKIVYKIGTLNQRFIKIGVVMGGRTGEILLILVIFVLLFGAQKLPEVGAALGKAIREFKKNMKEVEDEVNPSTKLRVDAEPESKHQKPVEQKP